MKHIITFFVILFSIISFGQIRTSRKDEDRINELLKKMTLEEKVGQMTQITLGAYSTRKDENSKIKLDINKLKEGIIKYHVGSILNTGGAANSLEEWYKIITTIEDIAVNQTRLKIPVLYGIDAIHGTNYTKGATIFPHSIALAASRNRDLVRKSAEITAYETKASGIPWDFNPVLGLGRQPLWPRFFETFGEDVYLTKEMGKNYVEGLQNSALAKNSGVLACMKHYMGYSVPLNGKDRTPAWIPERQLRELFLPPFAEAVKAGALTVMINSSEINGIPTHSNYHIITEILKKELGFKGFVVSDWEDIKRLYDRDRVADSPKEAVRMAVMAGVDMSMVPYDYSFYNYLLELVKEGSVPESRIDDAVRRILRAKFASGIFENPFPDKSLAKRVGSNEFDNVNLKAAEESIILLKNNGNILPVQKSKRIFVTGPTANKLSVLNGGWTYTWQGNNESLYPKDKGTIYSALKNEFGDKNVTYVPGAGYNTVGNMTLALDRARKADVIVLCLGENPYCETPGNIDNLELPDAQLKYASELAKTGKPIILVLAEGRPRVFHPISKKMGAIVLGMLPGMEGGRAIAEVISGKINPSGKLPFTYPKSVNGFTPYDYKPIENFDGNKFECEFPFGHGLSYTDFMYSKLKINGTEFGINDTIYVSVNVKNIGERVGKEAVELYVTDLFGSVSRPNKELKGFEKISLNPGENKNVNFILPVSNLSFIGRDNGRVVEPGDFILRVENLKTKFNVK